MKDLFHLKERQTTVRTEIIAGVTTFMAMAYILMVNPGMFSELPGVTFGAVYISTALSAVIGTLLIGFLANLPLAQAPGMGLNAFFVYTVCMGLGFSYANALLPVLARHYHRVIAVDPRYFTGNITELTLQYEGDVILCVCGIGTLAGSRTIALMDGF